MFTSDLHVRPKQRKNTIGFNYIRAKLYTYIILTKYFIRILLKLH